MNNEIANVQVIFAEDMREESSGQFSLIGIFDDVIETDTLPITFAKFAMLITTSTLLESPSIINKFRFFSRNKADNSEKTIISHDFPSELIEKQKKELSKLVQNSPEQKWASMRMKVGGDGLPLEHEVALIIELTSTTGAKYYSNSLTVKKKDRSNIPSINIS